MKTGLTKSIYNAQSLFFISGLGYLALGLFALYFLSELSYAVQLHDIYFVSSWGDIPFFIGWYFLMIGIIYWLIKKTKLQLNFKLGIVHFILTLIPLIGVTVLSSFQKDGHYALDVFNKPEQIELNTIITILFLTAVLLKCFLF